MSTQETITNQEPRASEPAMSGTEVRERARRAVMVVVLRGVCLRVLALGGNVVFARLLLPRDFGIVALGATVVLLGSTLADAVDRRSREQLISRP